MNESVSSYYLTCNSIFIFWSELEDCSMHCGTKLMIIVMDVWNVFSIFSYVLK